MALKSISHGKATDTATIANGETVSGAVDLNDFALSGFITPAALTGTTMTFQGSADNGATYVAVHGTDGAAISYTVTTSKYYAINPINFLGLTHIKIVSGSAEGAARDITLIGTRALNRY